MDGAQVLDAPTLPSDLESCHATIQLLLAKEQQLAEQLDNATRKLSQMEHQLQQLLRRLYGRSSEKIDPRQMALFAEMLKALEGQQPAQDQQGQDALATHGQDAHATRKGHGRRKLAPDLPRERIVHDLPEEEKPCPCCGTPRTLIGEETSEQLDYVPAQVKVVEHVRLKYICKECEKKTADGGPRIVTAEKPLSPIEKGLAAPGLIAHLIVSRFADHLPYYRLERILGRHGIELARSTQSDIAAQAALALLPLHKLAIEDLLASRVIHTDDTPVDVLEPKSGKTREGRFWVYLGDAAHPQVVFDYTPNRKRDGPMNFLKDWGEKDIRYLQADAFGGYDGIYAGDAGGNVVEVACWAHARRYFHDARKTDHRNSAQALAYINLLYDVERDALAQFEAQARGGDGQPLRTLADIRVELRQERSAPIMVQLRQWLLGLRPSNGGRVLPKSPMGEAITYALNQWAALCVYLLDGELNVDNNASENALRRIALGRKNWLFCGSDNGGRTAAILFGLIAACQKHHVEPFAYLRDVLTRVAAHPHHRLAELLPSNWKPQA